MSRSPVRVVELCVYALIIIAAVIWMVTGGKLYNTPDIRVPVQAESRTESTMPPVSIPKGEIFPNQ